MSTRKQKPQSLRDVASRSLAQPNPAAELLSVVECEAVTGVSRWTWRQWAYRGKIASCKLGDRRLLIPPAELDKLIAAGMRPAIQTPGRAA
jgi:hypothetical protein